MRWLIVLPFARPGLMGMDFADALRGLGHEVRTFAYRRDNALYKNTPTKAAYRLFILRRLERACLAWRPDVVLVFKGGDVTPGVIRRIKARTDTLFVNYFFDNPLWMLPFACIEAYDLFFTKDRYAQASLRQVGLTNVHYLPLYCVPAEHYPVTPTAAERARYGAGVSLVGSRYDYRERFVRALADYPLRVWGAGWDRTADPAVRPRVAGGPVWGREKLLVYAASTLSLNHHHPLNDIVGTNNRTFELAAAGACQAANFKEDLAALFKPSEEILLYRDLAELRALLDHHLAHPDEARAIGANARRR
ncbi:MAG TPA: glycosyltransferase, partial [Methylomirabilota bacterium]|nr:glycosyltransferase [Methylomirabilota bacterium]